MTWEQKLQALQALGDTSLRMRKPGDWYVNTVANIKGDGGYGNGATPEAAVEDHWKKFAESGATVVVDAYSPSRREYRWNGFMWEVVG
jgi:hypothetical protein